jgi:hypothetical protein
MEPNWRFNFDSPQAPARKGSISLTIQRMEALRETTELKLR